MEFNVLHGIQNFLKIVNDNWTTIIIILCLINTLIIRVRNYFKLSNEDKVEAIKSYIKEIMIEKVTNAEIEYEDWVKAGALKRAQVIEEIFEEYPILHQVTDQKALIAWIDTTIDEALETMKIILEKNETVQ